MLIDLGSGQAAHVYKQRNLSTYCLQLCGTPIHCGSYLHLSKQTQITAFKLMKHMHLQIETRCREPTDYANNFTNFALLKIYLLSELRVTSSYFVT